MKILFLNVPMQGHINPTLPLVERLSNDGHEVHYYCDEANRQKIERRGVIFKDYGLDFANMDPNTSPTMITGAHMFLKLAKESIDKFLVQWRVKSTTLSFMTLVLMPVLYWKNF